MRNPEKHGNATHSWLCTKDGRIDHLVTTSKRCKYVLNSLEFFKIICYFTLLLNIKGKPQELLNIQCVETVCRWPTINLFNDAINLILIIFIIFFMIISFYHFLVNQGAL